MFVVFLGVMVVLRLVGFLLPLFFGKKWSGLQDAFPYAIDCFIVSALLVQLFLFYFFLKESNAPGSGLLVLIYLFVATFVFFERSFAKSVKFILLHIGLSVYTTPGLSDSWVCDDVYDGRRVDVSDASPR